MSDVYNVRRRYRLILSGRAAPLNGARSRGLIKYRRILALAGPRVGRPAVSARRVGGRALCVNDNVGLRLALNALAHFKVRLPPRRYIGATVGCSGWRWSYTTN